MQYAIISRCTLLPFIGCASPDSSPSPARQRVGRGTAAGRLHKRNQLPVADDVKSPSQRTGERCGGERWQNEGRQGGKGVEVDQEGEETEQRRRLDDSLCSH